MKQSLALQMPARVTLSLVGLFFALMLIFPTTYQFQRGALLAVLVLLAACKALAGHFVLHRDVIVLTLVTVCYSVAQILAGLWRDAPGALDVATVFVIWPLVYVFFIGVLRSRHELQMLIYTLILAALAAAGMGILLVAGELDIVPFPGATLFAFLGAGFSSVEGLEYNLYNISTLIFVFPFLLAVVLISPSHARLGSIWPSLAWLALGMTAVAGVLSGRRGLWLIMLVSPLVVLTVLRWCRLRIGRPAFVVLLLLGIMGATIAVLLLDDVVLVAARYFLEGFDFGPGGDVSPAIRAQQMIALGDAWWRTPLFGAGHGAFAPAFWHQDTFPWAYELSYMALLFQTGLVGILLYGAGVAWIILRGIAVARRFPEYAGMIGPVLAGVICFLIANATNPYLQKFDYLWVIFLPVAIINSCLTQNRRSTLSSSTGTPVPNSPSAWHPSPGSAMPPSGRSSV